jgi:hypothetical protein
MTTTHPQQGNETMSDQEVVKRANELAREFYAQHGCDVPLGYRFDQARHPQERLMWTLACCAMEMLLATDPDDAKSNLEEV